MTNQRTWRPIRRHDNQSEDMTTNQRTWWPTRGHDDQSEDMATNQRTWWPIRGHDDKSQDMMTNQRTFCQFLSHLLIILILFILSKCHAGEVIYSWLNMSHTDTRTDRRTLAFLEPKKCPTWRKHLEWMGIVWKTLMFCKTGRFNWTVCAKEKKYKR